MKNKKQHKISDEKIYMKLLKHEFHTKHDPRKTCNYQGYEHIDDDELDCRLCTLGYALGVASIYATKFQEFCTTPFIPDSDTYIWLPSTDDTAVRGYSKHIVHDGTIRPNTSISFIRDGDYEIEFAKENSSFEIQQLYADYMNYKQGKPCVIERIHFDELLKEVIAITKNSATGFTLIKEKNGFYKIIEHICTH